MAQSSTKAEYKASANIVAEISCLQVLLRELSISQHQASVLWCDNIGATYLATNSIFHICTKHVEFDFHFVCKKVTLKELNVNFLSTTDQVVDILTKPIASPRSRKKLNLCLHLGLDCEGISESSSLRKVVNFIYLTFEYFI